MEGQEYLNQISATNRPIKVSKWRKFLSSKLFWAGIAALIALIIIIIIGAILGSNKSDERSLSYALKLHLSNTIKIIDEYQPDVKSSTLRSNSASLKGVLSNTDKELGGYLTDKYQFKEKNVSQKITEEAKLNSDGLSSELFEAKINGILDRVYAHKMAYEISLFMAEENKIYNISNNDKLKEILNQSYISLEELYSKFNDFSETK